MRKLNLPQHRSWISFDGHRVLIGVSPWRNKTSKQWQIDSIIWSPTVSATNFLLWQMVPLLCHKQDLHHARLKLLLLSQYIVLRDKWGNADLTQVFSTVNVSSTLFVEKQTEITLLDLSKVNWNFMQFVHESSWINYRLIMPLKIQVQSTLPPSLSTETSRAARGISSVPGLRIKSLRGNSYKRAVNIL